MLIKLKIFNNHLVLTTKLDTKAYTFMQGFSGFTKWLQRDLLVRPTPQNIEYLLSSKAELEFMDDNSENIIRKYQAKQKEKAALLATKAADGSIVDDSGYIYKRSPMAHQEKAMAVSKDLKQYALFFEQGLGKTKVVIDNAAYLYEKGEIDMLLIVAYPNGLHLNWINWELPEDMPDRIPCKSFAWKSSLTKKKIKLMNEVIEAKDCLKVVAFNVEAFSSEKARAWILKCLENNRCMFVIDQSASIKNPVAKRTKFLVKKAAELAPYRRILDGAPVAENASELYSQFYFLDWEIIGCDTYTAFKNEFCLIGRFNEIKGYTNLDRLMARIEPYYMRVLEEDCLDLPQRVYQRFEFELNPQERKIYNEINRKKLSEFEGEVLETPLAIVKAIRLQQICSGWFAGEDLKPISEKPSRLSALLSLCKTLTGKTLIFGRFKADMAVIEKALPDCVGYHGSTPPDERERNKEAFQLGDAKYMVGNPSTMGIGHTLTAATNVVFYSNEYSLRFRLESEKRVHRKGQTKQVHIWDLVANKTNDSKIINALRKKKDVSDMILGDPNGFFLEELKDD